MMFIFAIWHKNKSYIGDYDGHNCETRFLRAVRGKIMGYLRRAEIEERYVGQHLRKSMHIAAMVVSDRRAKTPFMARERAL